MAYLFRFMEHDVYCVFEDHVLYWKIEKKPDLGSLYPLEHRIGKVTPCTRIIVGNKEFKMGNDTEVYQVQVDLHSVKETWNRHTSYDDGVEFRSSNFAFYMYRVSEPVNLELAVLPK